MSCGANMAQSCRDCMDGNNGLCGVVDGVWEGAWELVVLAWVHGGMRERLEAEAARVEAERRFDAWADGCAHLQLENDGRATERICRHPSRDDLSSWVICNMAECPLGNSRK